MKPKLQSITLKTLAILLIICAMMNSACSETETTDSTKFVIYYSGMTDIGPSMVGQISKLTYKGNTPSDFAITQITHEGESYAGSCFEIDTNTGAISINSTKDMATGLYKISVSCISSGQYYEFKDAVEVNFLKAVPDGITVTPNKLQIKYSDISSESTTELATAQVTTAGDHISIRNYEIINIRRGEEIITAKDWFEISKSGKISIAKGNENIEAGIYILDLKLVTAVNDAKENEEGIFENAIEINIISAPQALKYNPDNDVMEEETITATSYPKSSIPTLKGSQEDVVYSISEVSSVGIVSGEENAIEKFSIDPVTGAISVAEGHGFKANQSYAVTVNVANKYCPDGINFDAAFTLKVAEYIEPISGFEYGNISFTQGTSFQNSIKESFKGGLPITFELINLPDELKGQLSIDQEGTVYAPKGNTIPVLGNSDSYDYTVQVQAYNSKNINQPIITSFTLTVKKNKNFFTFIHCGNNLGEGGTALEGKEYQNQFRFYNQSEMTSQTFEIKTDADPNVKISYKFDKYPNMKTGGKLSNGRLQITGWTDNYSGVFTITATAGEGEEAISVTAPIFVQFCTPVNGVQIEYTPLVLHVNPRYGGTSSVPKITGVTDYGKFILDYKRTFVYVNFGGKRTESDGSEHETGRLDKDENTSEGSKFLVHLWQQCNNSGKSQNYPMSYYENNKAKNDFSKTLGFVNNGIENKYVVTIRPGMWNDKGWASGFFRGEMIFELDGNTEFPNNTNANNKILPFMIWLDPSYEK